MPRRRGPEDEETVGRIRRLDSGVHPDRHPGAVRWPDERRPRPQPVDGPAAPVAEALRRRIHDGQDGGDEVAPDGVAALWRGPNLETHGWPVAVLGELLDDRPATGTRTALRDTPPDRAGRERPGHPRGGRDGAGVRPAGGVPRAAMPAQRSPGTRPVGTAPGRAPAGARRRPGGVEANARLTGGTAVVLLGLLGIEGITLLSIHRLLSVHVFIGMLLIPPVLLKMGSTIWKFAKYYLGDPEYRRNGPPPPLLRVIGPLVITLTLILLGSGVALLVAPVGLRPGMLLLHQASFVIWFMLMALHVLGHLVDTARLAPRDWYHRTRRQVRGATARQWAIATSLALGLIIAALTLPALGSWVLTGHG